MMKKMIMFYDYAGLTFFLQGNFYGNNSVVSITEVGKNENALLCLTDKINCCGYYDLIPILRSGEWFYPNGSTVGIFAHGMDFYRSRKTLQIRLNRRNSATHPTGLYCCEVASADDPNARICIHLSK